MSYQNKNKESGFVAIFVVGIILTLLAFIVVSNRQFILDLVSYWQYKPTAEVASIILRAGVNENGKFVFYASQPTLDGTQQFNSACGRKENVTSILGCYTNDRIYIYDVEEVQLDGIREVTAAHEMLHAAYSRLGEGEKTRIDKLEETEYKKIEDNKDLQAMMKYYDQAEPGQRYNELHSIIATQISSVSNELEEYYSRYFSDRKSVVALYQKYVSVFNKLDDQRISLEAQMSALETSINSAKDSYNSDIQVLGRDIDSFNNRAMNNDFTSMSQFYSERLQITNRIAVLEAEKAAINNDINKYNSLLAQYGSITSASKKLYTSIDSTLAPAPSV